MCIFSQSVAVACTNIFARSDSGRQFLVYEMTYGAADNVAMILPLPVPPRSPEDTVEFISLEDYPTFFDDMVRAFPVPRSMGTGVLSLFSKGPDRPLLRVHDVGSFEASFVPSLEDFDRLDPRFRLPPALWRNVPAYGDYGFAVFKLNRATAERRVHPMAFAFPQRDHARLYFPTVHIHDGQFNRSAEFDHALYCQMSPMGDAEAESPKLPRAWEGSPGTLFGIMNPAAASVIDFDARCWRLQMRGTFPNEDVWVG